MRDIEEIITGSRPWYSWISKRGGFFWWVLFTVIFVVLYAKLGILSLIDPKLIELFSAMGLSIFPTFGMLSLVHFLFPSSVFMIGQEKSRHMSLLQNCGVVGNY